MLKLFHHFEEGGKTNEENLNDGIRIHSDPYNVGMRRK